MSKIKYCIVLVSIVYSNIIVFAQPQLPDGVIGTTSFLNEIVYNYNNENSIPFDLNEIDKSANISIRVHIIKDMSGTTGVDPLYIYNSVSIANNYFKPIGIQFFIDSIDYVNDYNYSNIAKNNNLTELITKHAIANKINLFIVDYIQMGGVNSYGFTYFPNEPDNNFIFLVKNYVNGNSLTTMLGHFMGLLSTHENGKGMELVSEANCAASGDLICDTYADPDLFNSVDGGCKYLGEMRDIDGKYYVPSVANIMSNSDPNCKCIFTPLQYRRMYYYYYKYRQYMNN